MYGQLHGERIKADISVREAGTYLVEYPGKHWFWDNPPTVACGPSLGPGVDVAEGWSWSRAGQPGRAGPANAPRSAQCLAGTHCGERTPVVDQREGSDQREHWSTHRRFCFRHQTHVRDTQQVGAARCQPRQSRPARTRSRAHDLAAADAAAGARLVLASAP
jgi:hypothetical protein